MDAPFSAPSVAYVGLPDALLPSALPQGWTVAADTPVALTGPEGDLRVTFVVIPNAGSAEEAVRQAWQEIEPGFDKAVRQQVEAPSAEGWDSVHQVVYAAPAADEEMVLALVRLLGERAYVNLVQGKKAAFSRRGAQLGELINAWKPSGLREPSLAGRTPKRLREEEQEALRRFLREAMAELQIPGVAVAIVESGETVYAEGFGVCRVGGDEPVSPATRFMIGSSTKPLTTLMMARLVDRNAFTWDSPVVAVLPGFALADAEVTGRLRMRHTVCACTGMPRRDMDLMFRFEGVRPEDRIAEMREMLPTTGLGETFQYSNYLVAAGGYAAAHSFAPEASLADAYEQAMSRLVFEPLGMADTTVLAATGKNSAAPHGRNFEGAAVPIDPVLERFADAVAPAGSVWSTALDMAEYVKCELGGGFSGSGERVVSAQNLLLRREPGIRIDDKNSYGLGLLVSSTQGVPTIMHGGNTLGFTSDMWFLPEHGIGVVVLTNLRVANVFLAAVKQRFFELVFGAEEKSAAMLAADVVSRAKFTRNLEKTVKTDPDATAWLRDWVGEYHSAELGRARLFERDGGGYGLEFESWSSGVGVGVDAEGRELALISAPWRGALRLQADAEAEALVIDGGQTKYSFRRVRPA